MPNLESCMMCNATIITEGTLCDVVDIGGKSVVRLKEHSEAASPEAVMEAVELVKPQMTNSGAITEYDSAGHWAVYYVPMDVVGKAVGRENQ